MHEDERKKLIDNLRKKGVADEDVLNAMLKVERHLFMPKAVRSHAYEDVAVPIGFEQTISQPYTVAVMTQALAAQKGDKILEIGTGSGYQAAVLAYMGCRVYSIERSFELYERAQKLFDELKIRAALRCADGTLGWEEFAPFKGIIVTAGGPSIPEKLKKQLAVNGKMVIPVGDRNTQTMFVLTKNEDGEFSEMKIPSFAFVPLIGKEGWREEQL